jgi:hypothetical protein
MEFDDDYFPSGYDPYHAVNIESADSLSMNRYVQTLADGDRFGPGLLIHDEKLLEASMGRTTMGSVGKGEIPEILGEVTRAWSPIIRVHWTSSYLPVLYDLPEGGRWPPGR